MAGRGAVPKPAAERRRRNVKQETELPVEGNTEPFPALPAWREWRPDTVRWYEEWCRSPMATEWSDVHFTRMHQISVIYDDWLGSGNLELVKELRLQLAPFGGTPGDLRRNGRKVTPRPAGQVVGMPANRPARRLRAVDHPVV